LKIGDNGEALESWIFLFLYLCEDRLFAMKTFLAEKQKALKIPGSHKQWKAKTQI